MFTGFRRNNPVPEIVVPIAVPKQCAVVGLAPESTPKEYDIGDLALISCFCLLRAGKYTQTRRRASICTIQFRFCDVAFKKDSTIIARTASLNELLEATGTNSYLSNNKNSIIGGLVHQSAMTGIFCPIKALVRKFVHVRDNKADNTEILSAFWDHIRVGHAIDKDMRVSAHSHQARSQKEWYPTWMSGETFLSGRWSDGANICWR